MVRVQGEIGVISDSRGPVSRAVEKPPTSYTPGLIALLRADYESGRTVRAICKDYGLDRVAVMKHLRASGAKLRRQGLTPEQAAHAAEMYKSGLTLAQVGAHFQVAQGTVRRHLNLRRVQMRPALIKAQPSM
jgi:DNA-binding transcriptional ArsR family regulator